MEAKRHQRGVRLSIWRRGDDCWEARNPVCPRGRRRQPNLKFKLCELFTSTMSTTSTRSTSIGTTSNEGGVLRNRALTCWVGGLVVGVLKKQHGKCGEVRQPCIQNGARKALDSLFGGLGTTFEEHAIQFGHEAGEDSHFRNSSCVSLSLQRCPLLQRGPLQS